MFCPKCGVQNSDDATECTACKNPFTKVVSESSAEEKLKMAAGDTVQTLKKLGMDPVGGLLTAYESLGTSRALGVGAIFGLVFAFCIAIGSYIAMPNVGFVFMLFRTDDPVNSAYFKVLLAAYVPFIGLTLAIYVGQKIAKVDASLSSSGFVAGSAMLPLGFLALLFSLIGAANAEVSLIVAIITACLTVLIIYTGLTRISKLSDQAASYTLPLVIIFSAWITKVIFVAVLS